MISTFHGIETGKKGLISHQSALNTTGHNLSNVSNEHYSRQKVLLTATKPLSMPGVSRSTMAGQLGGGVEVSEIVRIRDYFLEHRLLEEFGEKGYWDRLNVYLDQLDGLYNQPDGDFRLKVQLEHLIRGWKELSEDASHGISREALRSRAMGLTQSIRETANDLNYLGQSIEKSLIDKVGEVNTLLKNIAHLNRNIARIAGETDQANDLKDERDRLIQQLSLKIGVQTGRTDKDEFLVYLGSERLIQGDKYEFLDLKQDGANNALLKTTWETGQVLLKVRGEVGGLLEFRNNHLNKQQDRLDQYALHLIDTVNEIHRDGYTLGGNRGVQFFKETQLGHEQGGLDTNGDGRLDATAIYKVNGKQALNKQAIVGLDGVLVLGNAKITYNRLDSVGDIIKKINQSSADLVAYLNHRNELTLRAVNTSSGVPDFILEHIEDSGGFLVEYAKLLKQKGQSGAYDWTVFGAGNQFLGADSFRYTMKERVSQWIRISEQVERSANNIAAAQGRDTNGDGILDKITGPGDGNNALKVVASLLSEDDAQPGSTEMGLDEDKIFVDKAGNNLRSFLDHGLKSLGVEGQAAEIALRKGQVHLEHLQKLKESISGVNIDEEMAAMVSYQHGYQASARFISYIDRLLDTIINKMGV